MSYIASWSGGKESCFACYLATKQGYEVSYLVNFISKKWNRVSFHGIEPRLISLQSDAVGVPLLQKETTPQSYEQDFKEAVESLEISSLEGVIFGDIYSKKRKAFVDRVCGALGIKAIEPLWGKKPEKILTSFIDAGFQAIVISAKCELIDEGWIGHPIDRDFMAYLTNRNVDVCGENGEYHSLVIDGPLFKKRIRLLESKTIIGGNYWFLDAIKYQFGH